MAWCGLARLLLGLQLVVGAAAPDLHELRLVDAGGCLADCTQGLIEIYDDGEWWAICDDRWDEADAEVACRQLDMRGGQAYQGPGSAEAAIAHAYECGDTCASAVWDNEPHCSGSEARLAECSHARAAGSCGTSERAGLLCDSGPSVGVLVVIAASACAAVAAVVVSCRLAIARARDLKRLDSVTCADVVRSWLFILRAAPRACLCGWCTETSAGTGYGRPKRKKTAVRQEAVADHLATNHRGDVESSDALPPGRSAAAALDAAVPAAFSVPRQVELPLPSQASTSARPDAPEAKGLRRPLSAGGAERRAAVAQRWIQEGMIATGPEPKRPSELIAEVRGEEPADALKRNRRKSNVTATWLAQSESAVLSVQPGHADATLPLDPLEPAVDVPGFEVDDDYGEFVAGGGSEVRLGEEASPNRGAGGSPRPIP